MGLKKPRELTIEEADDYLRRIGFIDYDFSFILPSGLLDTLHQPRHALDTIKLHRGLGQPLIQLRIYDASGNLVNGYAQCYGPFNRLNILAAKDFVPIKHLPNNYSLVLSDELSLIPSDDSLKSVISQWARQKKYVFVVYWNHWLNYYSRDIFRHIKRYFRRFDNRSEILVILFNNDSFSVKNSQVKE